MKPAPRFRFGSALPGGALAFAAAVLSIADRGPVLLPALALAAACSAACAARIALRMAGPLPPQSPTSPACRVVGPACLMFVPMAIAMAFGLESIRIDDGIHALDPNMENVSLYILPVVLPIAVIPIVGIPALVLRSALCRRLPGSPGQVEARP